MEEEEIVRRHIATHPVRYEIARMLLDTSGLFVYEMAEKLELSEDIVASHLMYLDDCGIIKTELRETGKQTPVVARYVTPTTHLYIMESFLSSLVEK